MWRCIKDTRCWMSRNSYNLATRFPERIPMKSPALEALQSPELRDAPVTAAEPRLRGGMIEKPRSATVGARGGARRPWWRRNFGGRRLLPLIRQHPGAEQQHVPTIRAHHGNHRRALHRGALLSPSGVGGRDDHVLRPDRESSLSANRTPL